MRSASLSALNRYDLVETVQEFWVERAFNFLLHQVFDFFGDHVFLARLEAEAFAALQVTRADVRSHDDDRVFEINGVAQAVGELSVFKNLKKNIEDIGMRFFYFIQQHDGIWRALHTLGELTAFFVSNVSGRRTDQF